jgi:hypothetical protein
MFAEVTRLIEASRLSIYALYQDEQTQITQELIAQFEAGVTLEES